MNGFYDALHELQKGVQQYQQSRPYQVLSGPQPYQMNAYDRYRYAQAPSYNQADGVPERSPVAATGQGDPGYSKWAEDKIANKAWHQYQTYRQVGQQSAAGDQNLQGYAEANPVNTYAGMDNRALRQALDADPQGFRQQYNPNMYEGIPDSQLNPDQQRERNYHRHMAAQQIDPNSEYMRAIRQRQQYAASAAQANRAAQSHNAANDMTTQSSANMNFWLNR